MAFASSPSAARLAHRNASVSDCGSTPGEPTRYQAVRAKHASRWFCWAAIFYVERGTQSVSGDRREFRVMTHVVVDGECGVLWATHFAVFIALSETVRAWSITKLRGLRKELCGIFIVNKYDVVDTPFMEERELVKCVRELGSSMLGGAFEPLDTFLWPLRQAEFSIEFGKAEPVERTGMGRSRGFAVKLNCLGRLPPAAPAVLATCTSTIRSIRVAMLSSEDEKGEGAIKVLAVLVCPNTICKTVREEVLRGHVSTVGIAL
jgi:hypothetical protein